MVGTARSCAFAHSGIGDCVMAESVPSVLESEARGEIADVYADIRKVLGTSVVNLIWRNLATKPGALEWTWSTVHSKIGRAHV